MPVNKQSNNQDLLKLIGITSMMIDHFGLYFFPHIMLFRSIGRLAITIFCFFAGYNLINKEPKKVIFQIGVVLMCIHILTRGFYFNILLCIYFSLCILHIFFSKIQQHFLSIFPITLVLFCLGFIGYAKIEYGTLALALCLLGYEYRRSNNKIYPILAVALGLSYNLIIFDLYFSDFNKILCIFLYCILAILFLVLKVEDKFIVNINIVSRNTLFIYFSHVCLFEFLSVILYGGL